MALILTETAKFCEFRDKAINTDQFLKRLLHGLNACCSDDLIRPGASFSIMQGDREKRADQKMLQGAIAFDFRIRQKVAPLYYAWRNAIRSYLLRFNQAITLSK